MHINIVRPQMPPFAEVAEEFRRILETGMATNNGPLVNEFEQELRRFYGCPLRPSVYCNGELGLYHLLQAWKMRLGAGPHDSFEVLVPSFTFSGTIHALVNNNLRPVFCDVDDSLVLDLNRIQRDEASVRMVLPVGAYGNTVDLEALQGFSKANDLAVVLDNAPSFGTRFKGRHVWEYGFSEMVSFHATKILSSMEGGCNVVTDPQLDEVLRKLRDFGQYEKQRGDVDVPGLNSKMTEVCALVGLHNLRQAETMLAQRAEQARAYNEHFGDLQRRGILQTMRVREDVHCPYLYFPLILPQDATDFVQAMQSRGVAVRRYYTATHQLTYYRDRYRCLDLSFTESIKDRIVSLPLHTQMDEATRDYLFESVRGYFL
jgi:dTDP-4-amino-4,6-dideoxygalactose transaminase